MNSVADRSAPLRLSEMGHAWLPLVASTGTGCVLAAFDHAAYLEVADDVVALVGPSVWPGPLHARADVVPAVQVGDTVELGHGLLRIGPVAWRLEPAAAWTAPPIDAGSLAARAPWAVSALTVADRSSLAGEPLGSLLASGVDDAVSALAGRGAGLTPAGDDVLAGIFVVRALLGADRDEMSALARAAPTHPLSRAFLMAAAQGESIEPLHHLLAALSAGDRAGVRWWQQVVARIGASSGSDLVLGVRAALQNGRSASQTA